MTEILNTHEFAVRQKKVAALVDLMVRAKITHADALLGLESEWETAAKSIGLHKPSKETIRLVLEALKSLETPLPGGKK